MKYTPHILGAVMIAALTGAVSGAAIGDSPVLKRGLSENLPEAPIVRSVDQVKAARGRPPDHYPLKTQQGTIAVEELSLHGRLRNRGGDMWWQDDRDRAVRMSGDYDFYDTASPERIEHERRLLAYHQSAQPERRDAEPVSSNYQQRGPTRAEAPMALAEPVEVAPQQPQGDAASTRTIGNAKVVDVPATLAERDRD